MVTEFWGATLTMTELELIDHKLYAIEQKQEKILHCLSDIAFACSTQNRPKVGEDNTKEVVLRIEQEVQRLFTLMEAQSPQSKPDPVIWIDQLELQRRLNFSRATVYRHRANGILPYIKKGSRAFYYWPGILKIKDHYLR